jgi:hypothetical protein
MAMLFCLGIRFFFTAEGAEDAERRERRELGRNGEQKSIF